MSVTHGQNDNDTDIYDGKKIVKKPDATNQTKDQQTKNKKQKTKNKILKEQMRLVSSTKGGF